MKLGLLIPLISRYATPKFIRALGTTADRLGFHSIWVGEQSDLSIVASPYPHKADPLEMVRAYKELGVTELVLMAYPDNADNLEGVLEQLASQYMDRAQPGTARLS